MLEFETIDIETIKILKERIEYAEMYPEKIKIIGEQTQLDNPMFTENQWTKILTTKAGYKGGRNGHKANS